MRDADGKAEAAQGLHEYQDGLRGATSCSNLVSTAASHEEGLGTTAVVNPRGTRMLDQAGGALAGISTKAIEALTRCFSFTASERGRNGRDVGEEQSTNVQTYQTGRLRRVGAYCWVDNDRAAHRGKGDMLGVGSSELCTGSQNRRHSWSLRNQMQSLFDVRFALSAAGVA